MPIILRFSRRCGKCMDITLVMGYKLPIKLGQWSVVGDTVAHCKLS